VGAVWADSDRLKAVQWLIGVVPVVEWRCSVFLSGSREGGKRWRAAVGVSRSWC
jgi:hypothetical protein